MTFFAKELDNVCPAYGWQGGPEFFTNVVQLMNGHERRNANWDQVRHRYTLPFQSISDDAYLAYLKSAFLAMRGQLHSFLIKDWSDNFANNESLGVAPAGSTPVQLRIQASYGLASYSRIITKPLASVVVKQAGVTKAGTLDTLTGLFTPSTAWTAGEALTWTGGFLIPVRFANDALPMSIDNRRGDGYSMSGSIELVEVFGE